MSKPVPILRLILDHGVTYNDVENNPQIVSIVMDELIDAVKEGIKSRRRNISLFQINDSNYIVGLDKKQWKPSLETALKHYEVKEEYTKCSEIKKMIDSL
jgi:hypothetical protein